MKQKKDSSWEKVHQWYDACVGKRGHDYHQSLLLPNILRLLKIQHSPPPSSLLDLGCGQGILARSLPSSVDYCGIDLSPSLIEQAKKYSPHKQFILADAEQPFPLEKKNFDRAIFLLSLQNMANPDLAILNARHYLAPSAELLLILNHPCFRIPRQSSWGKDPQNQLQYRRVNRYLSPLEIPIQATPSLGEKSEVSYSYHHPLSSYTEWLLQAGFSILKIEEWASDKTSTGRQAKHEDRAREEFPLFLAILARVDR